MLILDALLTLPQDNLDILSKSQHPRALQQALLDRLLCSPDFLHLAKDAKAVITLKKRLQRSRKFYILAHVFGTTILHAPPEISVTRIDKVGISDLSRHSTGSVEASKVKVIVEKMTVAGHG